MRRLQFGLALELTWLQPNESQQWANFCETLCTFISKKIKQGDVRPPVCPVTHLFFSKKCEKNRSATRHKGETHQVCPNVMLLHLCVCNWVFYAYTLRQMGVICHSGWVSVWWSDCISRVNADGEPGPPPLHKYVQQGNGCHERINWGNDGKGARRELSIMNIHYWVGALGGMGGIWTRERKNGEVEQKSVRRLILFPHPAYKTQQSPKSPIVRRLEEKMPLHSCHTHTYLLQQSTC